MSNATVAFLKDCKYYLQNLELCSDKGPTFGKITIPSAVMNVACVFPMSLTVILMLRFVVISGFDLDLISSTFAISIGVSQMCFIYTTLAINRRLILRTMDEMQYLVDYRCQISSQSVKTYKEAEENNMKLIRKIRKFVIIGVFICYLPSAFPPIFYLIFGFPTPDLWLLPFKGGIANEHTYSGFYISYFVQLVAGSSYLAIFGITLSMQIGFCQFVNTCSNDLEQICLNFNEIDLTNNKVTKTSLKVAIKLHQDTLNISEKLQTILAGSLFFQIVVCATFLAFMLFSIDQNLKGLTSDVIINLFSLLLEIMLNYISCNHAQMLTDRSFQVNQYIYDILWYKLPCDQQKIVGMIINRAQIPFHLHGYQIFTCSMETFLKMIRASFSYFLVLNELKNAN